MLKYASVAVFTIFITWSVLDFLIHGVLLQSTYQATANLWRPMDEMNLLLMYSIILIFAICFVAIYALLIEPKSMLAGVKFGCLFGLAVGISMGLGSYSYMPIPMTLAWVWFLGSWVELIIAGVIVGGVMRTESSV